MRVHMFVCKYVYTFIFYIRYFWRCEIALVLEKKSKENKHKKVLLLRNQRLKVFKVYVILWEQPVIQTVQNVLSKEHNYIILIGTVSETNSSEYANL